MTEQEKFARLMQERVQRERDPHVPPDHIVTGNCTFEALNRYLTLHPFETIRAIEAIKMFEWLQPLIKAQMADNPMWGLRDIIGDNPNSEEKGK